MVDVQVAQALVESLAQPLASRVARPGGTRVDAALGRDDQAVAIALEFLAQRPAQQRLRLAEAVRLRGVEEVDPAFAGVVDRRDGDVLVEDSPVAAQLPGTERDPRDFPVVQTISSAGSAGGIGARSRLPPSSGYSTRR